jgi:serine/threonine protein kinase
MKEYDEGLECCPECGFVRGTPPKEIYHLHPEVVLADRYEVGTVVAYGGFGILYRAWDKKLEVMVAVKEYFPSSYVNRNPGEKEIFIYTSKKQGEFQEGLQGFLEEARNTAKFSSHPNIVNVYDYFKENGTAYMIMEFMDGVTLKQYTKEQGGKLPWKEAVDIITGICNDLQVVHQAGILHRDISPDNIMLCNDGSIKLFDFGAARFSDAEKDVTRTIILKIGFAPPEQYRAKSKQGPWTDVYALGATLYRTITGQLPDESVNRQEAILKEGKDTLIRPREFNPDIPEYLDIAICRAMAIQPELRFKDVLQMKEALLNKKQYVEVEKELKRRRQRRKAGMAALGVMIAGGIGGCLYYYQTRQNAAELHGAEITIWKSVADTEDIDNQKQILESMTADFQTDYPEVSLNIVCIPKEDYLEKLRQAAENGDFPTLYESAGTDGFAEREDELGSVLDMLNLEDYVGLKPENIGTDVRELPLGIQWPVIYVNSLLQEEKPAAENDETSFLAGKSRFMVADTGKYEEVQEQLPGIYSVSELNTDHIAARYDQLWSVDNHADTRDRDAAKRLLYYFLSETDQDILHIQNTCSLPLNKSEMSAYLEINQEFSFVEEQLEMEDSIEFLSGDDYQSELDSDYQKLITDGNAVDALNQ